MKIDAIEIENFRCIEHLKIENIAPLFLVEMENGKGKSSLIYAIQFALFGHCEKTARNGSGASALISHGAKSSKVTLWFQYLHREDGGCYKLSLGINRNGKKITFECIDCTTGEAYESREEMWGALGIKESVARAAAMPRQWMEANEAGELLSGLMMPEEVGAEMLAYLDDMDGVKAPFQAYCEKRGNSLVTLDDFRSVGAAIYSHRTEINRELKIAEVDLESMPIQSLPRTESGQQLGVDDREAIQRGQAEVASRLEALTRQEGAQAACVVTPEELAEMRKEEVEATAKLQEAEEAVSVAQAAWDEGKAKSVEAGDTVAIQAKIDALGNEQECGTCGQEIVGDARRQREKKRTRLGAALVKAKLAEVKLAEMDATLRTREKSRTEEQAKVDAIKARISEAEKALEAAAKFHLVPRDSLADEIQACRDKMARGEDLLNRIGLYAEREALKEYVAEMKGRVDWMTEAIDAYRNGKAENEIAQKRLGDFLGVINDNLTPFYLSVEIQASGKVLEFYVQSTDLGATPLKLCSESEQALCAFFAADALAEIAGGPIVMLDNVDDLDSKKRATLIDMLRKRNLESTVLLAWAKQDVAEDKK